MKVSTLIICCFLSIKIFAAESKSLTQQLEEKAKASSQKTPAETKKIMKQAIEDLRNSQIMEKAKKKGDLIKPFELKDPIHGLVRSRTLLKKGPVIITFYRGSWCPYCNLQLRDLQTHLGAIKGAGAELVAISPEAPDRTLKNVKEQKLGFYVLSDTTGEVIKSFGLMYELPKDLIEVYKKFGIDLPTANKAKKWALPLSATYIVNEEGKIVYSFVDADYKKRAETKDLIEILKSLK